MKIIRGPYLQRPDRNSVTIMWQTDLPSDGSVIVRETALLHTPINPITPIGEPRTVRGGYGRLHKVRLCGLSNQTEYCYEVISTADGDEVRSECFPFRLALDEGDAVNFVITAEYGGCEPTDCPNFAPTIERIRLERPDFILSLGDITNDGTIDDQWDGYFFANFGRLISSTPFYPCVGNHEVGNNATAGELWRYENYLETFDFPRYYSFDYGSAHFCVLDCPSMFKRIEHTPEDKYIPIPADNFEDNEQIDFLRADLSASDAKWKFVIFHYPPYTSSRYDVREMSFLAPIFEEYGVDVVFNSHAVIYERSHPLRGGKVAPDGVRYVVVGSPTCREHWLRHKSNRLAAKVAGGSNIIRVSLTPYRFELQAISLDGKLIDSLVIDK